MFDPTRPFVLLDDATTGRARLFTGVEQVVTCEAAGDVAAALERLRAPGPWAGFIGFEAGYALEPRLAALDRQPPPQEPLLWFGRFASDRHLDAAGVAELLGHGAGCVDAVMPGQGPAAHAEQLAGIAALIAAGDIYQANLTFNATVAVAGHPLHLFAGLRAGSRAPFGALVFTGALWLLSFSPELFFELAGGRLTARPMKGTAPRGGDAAEDAQRAAALQADPKNRAENLMIVDLLRNDLSRVAGDVQVPALFEIETYPTVLQMTSTITATAYPGVTAADVLARLFPCGSVTGAPKIRAMEVIAAVEPEPRGAYTGSIGAIAADGDAVFNVAIRTLVLPAGAGVARLGLGSGIVADSDASSEWAECLAKAAFLRRRGPPDLIETLRCVGGGFPDADRHLDRMAASAGFLGHRFDRAAARAALNTAAQAALNTAARAGDGRVRLLLAPSGAVAAQWSPLPPPLPDPLPVALVPLPVAADDWRLRHKTSDRGFYDAARRAAGTAEVVFVAADGSITEGSFTCVFVERDGGLLTPAGPVLPGVLRARLLADGSAREARLTPADLECGFWLGNALRGLFRGRLA